MARAKTTKSKTPARKKAKAASAGAKAKPAARKAVTGKKPAAKKPANRKSSARKPVAPKKPAAKKKPPRKPAAVKAASARKKSSAKKPASKNTKARNTATKKAGARKVTAKKAAAEKAATKSAATKKAATKKAATKKAAPKKPPAKKITSKAARNPGGKAGAVRAKKTAAPKPAKAAGRKKASTKAAAPGKKKAGVEDVKAAADRTRKKVTRRGRKRQRVTPTSTPLANWIPKDGLKPSSFLPAPPRAQSAFTVAAPPASSDRLVRVEDLEPPKPIRTIPVLIHVMQEGGRINVRAYPPALEVAPGDAVEWDFRYFGGADVLVAQVLIEIERPSPFGKTAYRSNKPGSARPHRQVSDLVKDKALDSDTVYRVHCMNAFKTELAQGRGVVSVREAPPTEAAQ